MFTRISLKLIAILTLACLHLSGVQAATVPAPEPPQLAARAHVLMDFDSGTIISEKNGALSMEPASLTKLMTAYMIFAELKAGRIKLTDLVIVSEKAWRMGGSRTFIEVGKQVSIEDLMLGMIVQSGNDATVALAEHVGGSEEIFANLMNQRAQQLGMSNTRFVNSTGMPHPEHITTGMDLALLTRAIIAEFPEYYRWYSQREFTFNNITQPNRNLLLWRDNTVDGVKTGHTEAAGYCLVASAQRGDMRLISVVLGTKSENARAQESQTLLNYGFRFFETHRLYADNQVLTTVPIWKGDADELPLGLAAPLYITIPRGRYNELKADVKLPPQIMAPAAKGQPFGSVSVRLDDTTLADRPLVALKQIEEGSVFDQLVDEVRLMFE